MKAATAPRTRLFGYAAILAGASLLAVGGAVARHLMEHGAALLELAMVRAWIAFVVVGLVILFVHRREADSLSSPSPRQTIPMVLVFGGAVTATSVTYYVALSQLPIAVATVIMYTAPALVVGWRWAVGGHRPSLRLVMALLLAFAGIVLLSELPGQLLHRAGEVPALLGLLAALTTAVGLATWLMSGERLSRMVGAERALFYGYTVAAASWGVAQVFRGVPWSLMDVTLLPGILYIGVFATVVPFFLLLWGLRHIDARRGGIASMIEVVVSATVGFLWLGQILSPAQSIGGMLVLVGIAVVTSDRPVAGR